MYIYYKKGGVVVCPVVNEVFFPQFVTQDLRKGQLAKKKAQSL